MNALTTIQDRSLRFDFPEVRDRLLKRARLHLAECITRDRERSWHKDHPLRKRSEWKAAAKRIALAHLPEATATVDFQRTLRIPDDGKDYPLPPGLGRFPLRHVDDFAGNKALPRRWRDHGGIMLPMHQSEALWLNFSASYPVALKVGTGKICAVSGETWREGLATNPQNYCALPDQPWLDGYAVEKGVIRQFVAQPLGAGFTVEEQLTGEAEWGGIQLQAHPLDPNIHWRDVLRPRLDVAWQDWLRGPIEPATRGVFDERCCCLAESFSEDYGMEMGLAAGGRMKQDIYEDHHDPADYLATDASRCFVHLCNSEHWELLTGQAPPDTPPTAADYSRHGLPWFDYYHEKRTALDGGSKLKGIQSVKDLEEAMAPPSVLPENESAQPKVIVKYVKE